jgi:hypothetical protein
MSNQLEPVHHHATTTTSTDAAGTVVNAGDTAPTNDQWNLVAIELLSDD